MRSRVHASDGAGGVSAGRSSNARSARQDGGEEGREEPAGDGEAGGQHRDFGRALDAPGEGSKAQGRAGYPDPSGWEEVLVGKNI